MANSPPTSTFRPVVAGGGVTVVRWHFPNLQEHVIAFAQEMRVTEPQPVSPPQVVQPLDQARPLEIVTAPAQSNGTITLRLTHLYNLAAWDRLAGLYSTAQDITDLNRLIAGQTGNITITRHITPLVPNHPAYDEYFFNCVIASIGDDDPVDINTLLIGKEITFWFTHSIKQFVNGGKQFFQTQAKQSK